MRHMVVNPNDKIGNLAGSDQGPSEDNIDFLLDIRDFRCRFKNSLIFAHLNINSYRYKFPEMKELLIENLIDIVFISESKLDASFPLNQFSIGNFTCYRKAFRFRDPFL